MRVISQKGIMDVSYEDMIFCADENEIRAYEGSVLKGPFCHMAIYSNNKKALKAMEMLREHYMNLCEFNSMTDAYKKIAMAVMPDKDIHNLPVFQFPQDHEVIV